MNNQEYVLDTLRRAGKAAAETVQAEQASMTDTELNGEKNYIPDFQAARAAKNMLQRKAGQTDGFVCRSSAGRVVRLVQVYDSDTYPQEPEELPAQWRFKWSQNPKDALPFVSLNTSPYATGDCCTYEGHVWRSGQDTNTWAPGTIGVKWEDLGPVENYL